MSAEQQAIESKPSTNMRQAAADIMAEALGGGENPGQEPAQGSEQEQERQETEQGLEGAGQEPEGEAGQEQEGETRQEQEGEAGEIRTLAELAAAIEVEPEFLYGLQMPMADGEDPVPLGQLKDKLQAAARVEAQQTHFEQERDAFQREREAWNTQAQQVQQQYLQTPQEAIGAQARMVALQQAWAHLEENKDKYEAGDLALKKQEIQAAYGQAEGAYHTSVQQMQQQAHKAQQDRARSEAVKLLGYLPEWRDQAKAMKGRERITSMMSEYGFTAKDVDGVFDHRILRMLNDYSLLKAGVTQARDKIAKGKTVPKVLKPGASHTVGKVNKQKLQQKLDTATKSKNLRVKAKAVSALLSGA